MSAPPPICAQLRDHRLLAAAAGSGVARIHWRMRAPVAASLRDVIDVERGELGADARIEAALLRGIRDRPAAVVAKPPGTCTPRLRQRADHLAERGVLAADRLDVAHAELLERDDVCVQGCS